MKLIKLLLLGFICLPHITAEVYVIDPRTEEFRNGLFDKLGTLEEYLQNYPEVKIVGISAHRTLACHEYSLNKIFGENVGEVMYEAYKTRANSIDGGERMSKILTDHFTEVNTPAIGDLAVTYMKELICHSGIVVGEHRIESLWERHLLETPTFYYYIGDKVRYFRKNAA